MKMIAGFGGGMFVGSTCGALVGSVAALSKMVIKTKAHDQLDEIRPYTQKCVRNFKEEHWKHGLRPCKTHSSYQRNKVFKHLSFWPQKR